jgi:ATP-dependent helicase/nuclease subunit A
MMSVYGGLVNAGLTRLEPNPLTLNSSVTTASRLRPASRDPKLGGSCSSRYPVLGIISSFHCHATSPVPSVHGIGGSNRSATVSSSTEHLPLGPIDVEALGERTRSIDVAVNAVDTLTTHSTHDDAATPPPFTATSPPEKDDLPGLVPRLLRPSTIYPLSEDQEANILDHLQGQPLHTDTDTIDDELPITLNEFDTEDVGSFVHGVLTQCVDHNISAHDLRRQSATVERIIGDQLHYHGPPANQAERDGLIEFLTQFVFPDFVTSKLWKQLERADTVTVEKPLRMHIRRENFEV